MVKKAWALAGALSAVVCGCGGGSTAAPPATTAHASTVFRSASVGPSAQCPAGGIEVQAGIDQNGNGLLDAGEVQSTQVLCNGIAGTPGAPGDPGSPGSPGTPGTPGAAGLASLLRVTPEGATAQCPAGGLRVEAGLDLDRSGALSDPEVTATSRVCNGVTASAQAPVIVPLALSPSPPPAGSTVLQAAFSGSLGAGDALLADGTRADFLAITAETGGVLLVDGDTSGGAVRYYLFTSGCAAEPDVSRWGPCALGLADAIHVEPGQYLLLAKQVAAALPWEAVAYGARARFLPGLPGEAAGVVDTSFGTSGIASFAGSANPNHVPRDAQISFDAQGRILLGWGDDQPNDLAHVARLTADGALDTTFAGTGIAALLLPASTGFPGPRVTRPVESIDGTVVAGIDANSGNVVVRFKQDGSLDPGFGIGGKAPLPVGLGFVSSVASLADGAILVAASTEVAVAGGFAQRLTVLKFAPTGEPDAAFGAGGRADVEVARYCDPFGILAVAGGAILVHGQAYDGVTRPQGFVARLSRDGQPDANFGVNGVALVPFSVRVLRPVLGGGLIAAGILLDPEPGVYQQAWYARMGGDGAPDGAPGASGALVMTPPPDTLEGFHVDALDRVLVSGAWYGTAGVERPTLWRFLPDGAPDLGFGGQGVLTLSLSSLGEGQGSLAIDPAGRILAAGQDYAAHRIQVQRIK